MENTQTWLELASMYEKLDLSEKAFEIYQSLYDCGDRNPQLMEKLYSAAAKSEDVALAQSLVEEVVKNSQANSDKALALMEMGKMCIRLGDGQLALGYLNRSLELDPSLANQLPSVGMVEQKPLHVEPVETSKEPMTDADASIEENQEGLRLTMLLTMGIMHWRNGQLEDAEEVLTKAIGDAQKSDNRWIEALAWHSLALVRTAFGDIKGAIDAYLKAAELAPNQIFPWNKVGALYENLDMNDEAQAAYHKSLVQNPEDPESWNGMGDLMTKHGKLDEAVACYQLGNVFDHNAYGNDGIKVYQKALEYYQRTMEGLRLDKPMPNIVTASNSSGDMAEPEMIEMDAVNQSSTSTHEQLASDEAMVLEQNKPVDMDMDDDQLLVSIRKFETTVKENPFNDRAWDSLGNLYKIKRWYDKAIFAYENAVSIQPRKHIYHFQLGSLYAAYGNFNVAISEMQKVLEMDPTSTYAHCALANYFRRLGYPDKAKYHVDFAMPFMKNEKEYDRACFESVRGETNLALQFLETALQKKQTSIALAQADMDLDFIRQDPRFEALVRKYALEPAYA